MYFLANLKIRDIHVKLQIYALNLVLQIANKVKSIIRIDIFNVTIYVWLIYKTLIDNDFNCQYSYCDNAR